jgi:uncharacterized repeat protein (TIGR03803 family)
MRSIVHTLVGSRLLAAIVVVMSVACGSHAQTYQVLYSFAGGSDGANPYGTLIKDSQNNLYGTTVSGGDVNCRLYGCGTVFRLSSLGTKTTLVNFQGTPDGAGPSGGVIRAGGVLYGTTAEGGPYHNDAGTIFKVSASGESLLYSFQGGSDGADPWSTLVRDSAGNLYGTTTVGGNFANNYCAQNGCGTVFKIDATGYHTVLHTFSGPDGATPLEGLVRDAAGNLYGTTGAGGSSGCDVGCGVIYKIDPAGNETILHEFLGYTADGAGPNSNLIIDQSGNLYGTASGGGAFGAGIIYELSSTGVYTILHSFNGKSGGANPQTGVIRDGKGNLYGTTYEGGKINCNPYTNGCGVVYKLSRTGQFTVLHTFTGTPDGANPSWGSLLRDWSGNIYGLAANGGTSGNGVIFKITP